MLIGRAGHDIELDNNIAGNRVCGQLPHISCNTNSLITFTGHSDNLLNSFAVIPSTAAHFIHTGLTACTDVMLTLIKFILPDVNSKLQYQQLCYNYVYFTQAFRSLRTSSIIVHVGSRLRLLSYFQFS